MPIAPENRDRYPANWSSEIRPAILRRARLRCECEGECGRGHSTRCPEVHLTPSVWGRNGHTIFLTVAHLNHTPEDDDPEQLRAMCQGCHLHYDREHHRQSEVERFQRAIEGAGQLRLLEALGGHAACPPSPLARRRAASTGDTSPGPNGDASRDVAGDGSRYSLDRLPAEVRLGLDAAIATHQDAEAWLELARHALGVALADARSHGAQVNELVAAAALTKPRLYRLLDAAADSATNEEA